MDVQILDKTPTFMLQVLMLQILQLFSPVWLPSVQEDCRERHNSKGPISAMHRRALIRRVIAIPHVEC
jgi:hypothetical protein